MYSDSEQVTLNVGGYKFTTTIATLRTAPSPSLFNAMFSGRHALKPDDVGPPRLPQAPIPLLLSYVAL